MSEDYLLELKIKNAPLSRMMQQMGIKTASELARRCGIPPTSAGFMLNLKQSVFNTRGEIRPYIQKVCDALLCHYSDIYPEAHFYDPLTKNKFTAEVTAEKLALISSAGTDPMILLENQQLDERANGLEGMIQGLSERAQKVLRMRYEEGLTLEDVARQMGVTRERIRQMEAMSLRKMRAPKNLQTSIFHAGTKSLDWKPEYTGEGKSLFKEKKECRHAWHEKAIENQPFKIQWLAQEAAAAGEALPLPAIPRHTECQSIPYVLKAQERGTLKVHGDYTNYLLYCDKCKVVWQHYIYDNRLNMPREEYEELLFGREGEKNAQA